MAFPTTPRVIKVELFVSGSWVDITSDVYVRGGITISRGRKDEQGRAEPSSCQLVLDNRSGNYSPRNPVGVWYGSLGRNTPLRVNVGMASDTFARTVSSGWGTSDTGQTYTFSGSGGVVTSVNVNVAAGVGTIALTSTNISRTMTMVGLMLRDVDVSATVTMPFSAVTGASIYPAIIKLRDQGGTNYIYARTVVLTTGVVQLELRQGVGSLISINTAVAGLTYSGQALSLRFQAEGQTFRAKVWDATVGEPYDWSVTANTSLFPAAGLVGVTSWVLAGNTNTLPIVVSYDNLTVRVPRFSGEVAAWPQRWDLSGNDVYVPLQAAGITRRLGQGAAPLRSALYRYYKQLSTPPVAYWPGEDLKNVNTLASGVAGGTPMFGYSHALYVDLASYTAIPASAALFAIPPNDASTGVSLRIAGVIAPYTTTGITLLRLLLHIPIPSPGSPESLTDTDIAVLFTTGTAYYWGIRYRTGGLLSVIAFDTTFSTFLVDSGPISYGGDIRGRNVLLSLSLTEISGNVNWTLATLDVGSTVGFQFSGTLTGKTVNRIVEADLMVGPNLPGGSAYGHISVRIENPGLFDIQEPLRGYLTELSGTRMQRLSAEENIAFSFRGNLTETQIMGAQGSGSGSTASSGSLTAVGGQTFLDVLHEAEDVDTGTLYEPRGDIGLCYRTRADAYSQSPVLTMDYTAGQVAPPLEPVDDDQRTRNNIIVTRTNGGSVDAELTVGRMSTLDPSVGGVGRYDTQYTLNVASDSQLADLATWLLSLGTVDESRYPTISINLANPNAVAAGLESSALAVDVDDLLVVTNPKTGGTPDAIRQLVRGYTETLNVFTHTITFNCTPEFPYRVGQYDASPLFRYDTITSTLVSGVSSSATTISVANIGEPWTTDPTQMPIPILISGELMNVTAVSGTSTPQTFTVVRAVNGVVKAQLAGAVVQIYPVNSATYAL